MKNQKKQSFTPLTPSQAEAWEKQKTAPKENAPGATPHIKPGYDPNGHELTADQIKRLLREDIVKASWTLHHCLSDEVIMDRLVVIFEEIRKKIPKDFMEEIKNAVDGQKQMQKQD